MSSVPVEACKDAKQALARCYKATPCITQGNSLKTCLSQGMPECEVCDTYIFKNLYEYQVNKV